MIFCVDFDGTLVSHEYPEIGVTNEKVLAFVRKIKADGHQFILFTCRGAERTAQAVDWCEKNGIKPDAVNDDVEAIKQTNFGKNKSVKPFADWYLDDRAMTLDMVEGLLK